MRASRPRVSVRLQYARGRTVHYIPEAMTRDMGGVTDHSWFDVAQTLLRAAVRALPPELLVEGLALRP